MFKVLRIYSYVDVSFTIQNRLFALFALFLNFTAYLGTAKTIHCIYLLSASEFM